MRRKLLTVTAALAGVLVMAAPAHAAIDRPVAIWQLNEAAGARTMADSSGNGLNGVIGSHVQTGVAVTGGGHRLPVPLHQAEHPAARLRAHRHRPNDTS